ncbi:DUF3298 and DUF4163 domain-containing protein [Pseudoflavonifractor phocaeensis]|nr:DUF3298 and DUF4163 domain-containing protein [Pseudoflavonifractor phocaeensis]MBM6939137.1 DUF3298 and DUF4163 domain-containing protein [Pseudoflavonifractor phocaeensis]
MHESWEQAKARYEEIPIPEELSATVQAALRTGSRQSARRRRWLRGGLAGLAACLCFCVLVNSTPAFAAAVADIPVLGMLARVVSVEQYVVHDAYQYIQVDLPALENTGNTALEQRINTEIRTRIHQVLDEAEARAKETQEAYVATGGSEADFIPVDVTVDYEIKRSDERYLSFLLSVCEVRANAYTQLYAYNIDLTTGRQLSLPDLLGPDYRKTIRDAVLAEIDRRTQSDPDQMYFVGSAAEENDTDWADDPFSADPQFYLNSDGQLVVVYEKYAIAPGYMGQPEFVIPLPEGSDVSDLTP